MLGNKNKRILAVVLSAAMLLPMMSLAACKKKGASGSDAGVGANGNGGNGGQSEPMAGPTTADGSEHGDYILDTDTYFSAEEIRIAIPEKEGRQPDATEIGGVCFHDQIVVVSYMRSYTLTDAEQEEIRHMDFSDPDQLERYYDLQDQQQECGAVITSLSGDVMGTVDFHAYSGRCVFPVHGGGYGAVVERLTRKTNSSGLGKYLILFNDKGEITSDTEINGLLTDIYNPNMILLNDGQYLYYGSGKIFLLNDQFYPQKKLDCDSIYNGGIFPIDGKYYVIDAKQNWDKENNLLTEEFQCQELDTASLTLSAQIPLATGFLSTGYLYPDNGKVYIDDGAGICSVDLFSGSKERLMLWGDTDSYVDYADKLKVVSSEEFYLFKGATLIHFKKEAANPHAGKRIIHVGVNNIDSYYYQQIVEYNKKSDGLARVYVYYPNSDSYIYDIAQKSEAADKLLLDMRSGDGPDVLMNYSEFGQFDNDAVLVDLNPYIDGEKGIDRSLYYDNVFRAFETDGKLYQLPLTVVPSGILGNPDLLGDISGWTCDDYLQKIKSLPDGVFPILFESYTGNDRLSLNGLGILLKFLYSDMGHYVDYGNYEVHFDSDDFRKLLEIAKRSDPLLSEETFESMKARYGEMTNQNPIYLLMQDGVCACTLLHIRGLHDVSVALDLCHHDPVLIGVPTMEKPGLAAEAVTTIGISAFSEAPDEAWDFVRYFISPETQNEIFTNYYSWGFSICRESQKLAVQHEIEMEGGKQPDQRDSISQNVIDTYESLIEGITHRIMKNPSIVEIIKEEAPAYFEGYKTAEEVSKIIQDRASRVLQELE